MNRLGLVMIIVLGLAGGLGLLIGTADDHEFASLDPYHPATLLPLVSNRLHAVESDVRELIDAATAGFRATVQKHEAPKKALER